MYISFEVDIYNVKYKLFATKSNKNELVLLIDKNLREN